MELKDGIPLHKQISDWLRNEIETGNLEENEKLPSENKLSEKFDVSRVTVRRALQTLEHDQLIYRCQGLGSFVSDHRTHRSISFLYDFSEELADSGMVAGSRVLSLEQVDIGNRKDILSYLEIQNKTRVVKIERLRLGDGDPIAFDITWMPLFYGQLVEGYDLQKTTLFKILEEDFEIPIEKGCYRIESALADKPLADLLGVEKNTSLLLMNRISYTIGNKPVYYQKRYYRDDKIVFELMMERPSDTSSDRSKQTSRKFTPVFTNDAG